jgi:hypothetical protein
MVSHFKRGAFAEGVREQSFRRIFEPEWDEVTGEWRKLYSQESYTHLQISLGR